jgi:type I restriction enzyme S subunit
MAEYEAYKDSGAAWIGMIPAEWTVTRLKNHLRRTDARNPGGVQVLSLYRELGVIPKDSRDDNHNVTSEDTSNYKYVQPGDFVVNKMKAWQGSVAVSDYEGIVSPAYYVYKFLDEQFCKRYFHYLIRSCYKEEFMSLSAGIRIGQWDLSSQDLDNVPVLIPAMTEQTAIAEYLDRETDRIEAIIAEAKASIDEYKAWKVALVNDAVTHGIDRNAPSGDSGIYWIGHMPKHWNVKRLKYMFAIKKDIAGEAGYTILAITQQGVKPKNMADKGQFAADYSNYQLVCTGDFAMNHMDLLTGWVDISAHDGVTSPDYRVFYALSPNEICKDYYKHVFQNCYRCRIFYGLGHGVSGFGRWRLPADMFLNFVLPVPPLKEQQEIAEYLNTQCAQIDNLIAEKEALVADLEAYKKSLIFEVVTGKRKVV